MFLTRNYNLAKLLVALLALGQLYWINLPRVSDELKYVQLSGIEGGFLEVGSNSSAKFGQLQCTKPGTNIVKSIWPEIKNDSTLILPLTDFESGLYLIDDFPLVVRSKFCEKIVVVIPVFNQLTDNIITSFNRNPGSRASVRQNIKIDERSLNLIKELEKNKIPYSVISDYDLADASIYSSAERMIIAGNIRTATLEMKLGLERFLTEGKSILAFSTYLMNIAIWKKGEQLIFNRREMNQFKNDRVFLNFSEVKEVPFENFIGLSYGLAGRPKVHGVIAIKDAGNKLFSDVSSGVVPVSADFYMGYRPGTELPENIYAIDEILATPCEMNNIPGIGGVLKVRFNNGSEIMSMGSADWLASFNYQKSDVIKKIVSNVLTSFLDSIVTAL